MQQYLVGIDEGTTGCKTCVFDLEGNLISSDYREYPCYYPHPGWVEQVPGDITPALFESCKAAVNKAGVLKENIIALAISSQGAVWGPLDKKGKLIRPFLSWQDLRGTPYVDRIRSGEFISRDELYEITGYPIGANFCLTKYLWYRDNEPELYEKTATFSHHQDYFLKEFGAEGCWIDTATASRTGIFDINNRRWDPKLIAACGIGLDQLPTLTEAGRAVGTISKEVAEKTGLAEGTLLCMGAMDQNCSTMGGGLVKGGDSVVVMGTYGSIYVGVDEQVRDPNRIIIVKNNTGPENWTLEAASLTSASAYRWYRDTFYKTEREMANNYPGLDPYDIIGLEIESVEPGAGGITFLPYLQGANNGARANPIARGIFLGMSLHTKRSHIARAVMEGVTMEMRDNIETMRSMNVEMGTIRLTGGATKSRFWNQMQADMYKVPVQILQTSETGCLGAAIYAGIGAGAFKDYPEAVDAMVKTTTTYEPNPAHFAAYDEAFDSFLNAYHSLNNGGYFTLAADK